MPMNRPALTLSAALLVALSGGAGGSGGVAYAQRALGDGTALDASQRVGATNVNAVPITVTRTPAGNRIIDSPGDGRALDYNLQVGSGGFNSPGRNFNMELAMRNAVVTGNAPGGRSFRGDVGYTAANDFRGVLGSDTTFAFERDSIQSGLAARNLRGVGALQFNMGQSTGGQFAGSADNLIVRRPGGGIEAQEFTNPNATAARGIDPFGYLDGTLRSTSGYVSRNATFPNILAQTFDEGTAVPRSYLTASPIGGMRELPTTNPLLRLTEPPRPFATPTPLPAETGRDEDAPARPGQAQPVNPRVGVDAHDRLLQDLRDRSARVESRIDPAQPGERPADQLLPPPAEGDEAGAPTTTIENVLEQLRARLSGQAPAPQEAAPESEGEPETVTRRRFDLEDDNAEMISERVQRRPGVMEQEEVERLIERAREVLGHDPTDVRHLAERGPAQDLFTTHMQRGETLLNEARWFDAEERFSAALRARPGDPMAAAGRINAQIGAGMYQSAAVNLRNLVRAYPEMLGARFDASLLPSGERLSIVRNQLRDRAGRDTLIARDASLLLAYMGFQTDSPEDIRAGFDNIRRLAAAAGAEGGSAALDELERLLIGVWEKP